jgi:hypothetical protein
MRLLPQYGQLSSTIGLELENLYLQLLQENFPLLVFGLAGFANISRACERFSAFGDNPAQLLQAMPLPEASMTISMRRCCLPQRTHLIIIVF